MDNINDTYNELEILRKDIIRLSGSPLIKATGDWAQLRNELSTWINELILHDMEALIQLLYWVDINEAKLKFLLKEKVGEDAAVIITDLLIDRQLQKIKTRRQFQQPPPDNEEDRW